jgi:hypothetical protein
MNRSKQLLRGRSAVLCGATCHRTTRIGKAGGGLLLSSRSSSSSSSSSRRVVPAKKLRNEGLPLAKKSLRMLLVEARSAAAVRSLFASRGDEFTASNLSTAAHRLAKYGAKSYEKTFLHALRRSLADDDNNHWPARECSQLVRGL